MAKPYVSRSRSSASRRAPRFSFSTCRFRRLRFESKARPVPETGPGAHHRSAQLLERCGGGYVAEEDGSGSIEANTAEHRINTPQRSARSSGRPPLVYGGVGFDWMLLSFDRASSFVGSSRMAA